MNNLGNSLLHCFERLGDVSDINESVLMKQDAVQLTPDGHPDRPSRLNNLGNSLHRRFQQLGEPSDINESILKLQEAVQLTPEGHPDKPSWLNNLGTSLLCRFEQLCDLSGINESVLKFQDAVQLTPEGHPNKPSWLKNLGNSLLCRFEHQNTIDDVMLSLEYYSSAALSVSGKPSVKFQASSKWSLLAHQLSPSSLLDAYSVALNLLPQLAWLGSPITDHHFHVKSASAVVRRGAAAAIEADKHILSVEWLEQGRSVIWGQMLQLRTPLDALKAAHQDIALKLEVISLQLEQASTTPLIQSQPWPNNSGAPQSLPAVASYHDLAHERNQLIEQIRELPGFERFLLPKLFSELMQATKKAHGPIVMLNASYRCDALIIMPELPDSVQHVPLPDMSLDKAIALHNILQNLLPGCVPHIVDGHSEDTDMKRKAIRHSDLDIPEQSFTCLLSSLWKWMVEPIVKALTLTVSVTKP